jgi:AAA+ superfamily predicted ATPase
MDEALLSRFSRQVFFRLPNAPEIKDILTFYIPEAKDLDEGLLHKFE